MQGLGVVNIVATRDSVNNNARSLHLKTEGEKHRNEVFVCICSESALEIKLECTRPMRIGFRCHTFHCDFLNRSEYTISAYPLLLLALESTLQRVVRDSPHRHRLS